jgi:hypothetical protein
MPKTAVHKRVAGASHRRHRGEIGRHHTAGNTFRGGFETDSRGEAMVRRVVEQLLHEYGNGRAVENARRDAHRERFVHERIEAIVKRLPETAAPRRGERGVA